MKTFIADEVPKSLTVWALILRCVISCSSNDIRYSLVTIRQALLGEVEGDTLGLLLGDTVGLTEGDTLGDTLGE